MGRPRKAIESHLIEGTYRADRHGDVAGQILPAGTPIKPAGMSEYSGKLWDQVVTELTSEGVAKRIDTIALAEMCQWYARYRKSSDEFDLMKPKAKGANKMLQQALASWKEFEKSMSKFGLTPADRAKLRITDTKPNEDGVIVRRRA
jgi:P27 family predicted phage terminase small subunit